MASLTRTISIRFPQTPQDLAALRAKIGLSSSPRQRATPDRRDTCPRDRGFLTFGRCGPNTLNLPFKGDIS
jgi:hypothetical protein